MKMFLKINKINIGKKNIKVLNLQINIKFK